MKIPDSTSWPKHFRVIKMSDSTFSLTCVLGLLALSSACYIQNCPRGGKRSPYMPRRCISCGPEDRGLCFGPSICCGEGMGCYVGSPEAAACVEENYLPSLCEAGGKVCGSERGQCSSPGVCCDSVRCVLDPDCLEDRRRRPHNNQNTTWIGWSGRRPAAAH